MQEAALSNFDRYAYCRTGVSPSRGRALSVRPAGDAFNSSQHGTSSVAGALTPAELSAMPVAQRFQADYAGDGFIREISFPRGD